MTYTFYEDPGHGWLRVELTGLVMLGIWKVITSCSYTDGMHYAYLEEDCDLTTFLVAKLTGQPPKDWKEAAMRFNTLLDDARAWFAKNVETNDRAALRGAPEIFIRRLPSYSPSVIKAA